MTNYYIDRLFDMDPLGTLRRERRLYSALLQNSAWPTRRHDFTDGEEEYTLRIPIPGYDANDFAASECQGVLRLELRGDYWGHLQIPEEVETDRITVEVDKGILTVHLPKRPAPMPRTIPIMQGGNVVNQAIAAPAETEAKPKAKINAAR